MNIRQTVLQEGMNIFQRHGIKNLTMEEILAELNISRGTLIEIAPTKESLLDQCIEETISQRKAQINEALELNANPLQALKQLLKTHLQSVANTHPDFLPDLKNFHQPCWIKVNQFSTKYLEPYISRLLDLSIEAGLLQPELDAPLLSRLLIAQTNAISEAGLFHTFKSDFDTVFSLAFGSYLKGLATSDGLDVLQQALNHHPLHSLN